MVLSSIGCVDAGYTWVEAATQDSGESSLLKTIFVSPLPRVLKVCLVLRFVVSRVEVRATALQTSLHNGEVLIRQGEVHYQVGFKLIKEFYQLFYAVSINLCCLYVVTADGLNDSVAL